MDTPPPFFSHFPVIHEAVDEECNILVNCNRSLLFWFNFSFAKMLNDWLSDEEVCKNTWLSSYRPKHVDLIGLEVKKMAAGLEFMW